MKTKNHFTTMRLAICLSAMFLAGQALADVVYITARPAVGGGGPNTDLNSNLENVYLEENLTLGDTSAKSTVADAPAARSGSRYYASGTSLTNTLSGFSLKPDLAVPGGIYLVQHSFRQFGNNTTNGILSVVCTNGSLSFSETDVFQQSLGDSTWQTLGYVTNNPGVATPHLEFRYQSGLINAGLNRRLVVDVFKFSEVIPCLSVPVPTVQGPLATNLPQVTVAGVTSNATAVAVYQDSGGGMVKIGELTNGVVEGVNLVPVTGLVKNAVVSASQTAGGQESCIQNAGLAVGGGANPRIRVALSIRETISTGPVGTPGDTANANLHFLGVTNRIGGAPGTEGIVVTPSTSWQTLTFDADPQAIVGDTANAAGTVNAGGFYNANDVVEVQVYAFTNDPVTLITYFSKVGATSATVTSNNTFGVDWTWDAVPGAEGYRLLRSTNSSGFNEYQDAFFTTILNDFGSFGWNPGNTVTPNGIQNGASVQWNGTGTGNTNNIGTPWGTLDAIAIAIDDLSDTGPFDLYLDNLQNGAIVWEDFEGFTAGSQDVVFRSPRFSGSTSGNLLDGPNQSIVSNVAADSGNKSMRVRFQWNGTNDTKWVRLTTSGVGNPQVNLADPISLRMLLLPVGASPVPPPAPSLSIKLVNGEAVLDWTGAHTLLEADAVAGPYAPVAGPVTLGPYTNAPAGDAKFYKLVN